MHRGDRHSGSLCIVFMQAHCTATGLFVFAAALTHHATGTYGGTGRPFWGDRLGMWAG